MSHLSFLIFLIEGVFFNFEISPILVVHSDTQQSFAHFVTSFVPTMYPSGRLTFSSISYRTCAIVGGVLTVASLLDGILFATTRALKKSGGVTGSGSGYVSGKLM